MTRGLALLLPLTLLASCGGGEADDARAVTASEARELNEAAAMLDQNSVSADAVRGQELNQ